ncbi:hypothetical protein ElyMa_000407700 [Elysia marginata]|uniref:Lipocalin/cytosolic fatty-acid binding domain-containing protein n=1 Tax=Elysia marginata TaxID=1093978 RepID=A0AAV4FKR7_9GAST|nr:hypothetical protein ElyMa_000407700 [Elysia marginata]
MKAVFVLAVAGLLAPASVVAVEEENQEICHPPQSTTIVYTALSRGLWYCISDYENGFAYWIPADSLNGDSFIAIDLTKNLKYAKMKGQQCSYTVMGVDEQEKFAQCVPDRARHYGEINGRPIYKADYPNSSWFQAYTREEGTPYYHRYIIYTEEAGKLVDVGFALKTVMGIIDPSVLQLDLSACVEY